MSLRDSGMFPRPEVGSDDWIDGDLVAPPSAGTSPAAATASTTPAAAAAAAAAVSDGEGSASPEHRVGKEEVDDDGPEHDDGHIEFGDDIAAAMAGHDADAALFEAFQSEFAPVVDADADADADADTDADREVGRCSAEIIVGAAAASGGDVGDGPSVEDVLNLMDKLNMVTKLADARMEFTLEFWEEEETEDGPPISTFAVRTDPRNVETNLIAQAFSGERTTPIALRTCYNLEPAGDVGIDDGDDQETDDGDHEGVCDVFADTPTLASGSASAAAAAAAAIVSDAVEPDAVSILPLASQETGAKEDPSTNTQIHPVPRKGRCVLIATLTDGDFAVHAGIFTERYDLDAPPSLAQLRREGRQAIDAHHEIQLQLAGQKKRSMVWVDGLPRPTKRTRAGAPDQDAAIESGSSDAPRPAEHGANQWTNLTNTDLVQVSWFTDPETDRLIEVHLFLPLHLPELQGALQAALDASQVVR